MTDVQQPAQAGRQGSEPMSVERSLNGTWRPRVRAGARKPRGVAIPRHFTRAGEDPFDHVEWELRSARIANERGETIFEQTDVEVPAAWSALNGPSARTMVRFRPDVHSRTT